MAAARPAKHVLESLFHRTAKQPEDQRAFSAPVTYNSPFLSSEQAPFFSSVGTGGGGFARASSRDEKGIPAPETILVKDHITNTRAVVNLVQIDYSAAMRAYRVCRQNIALFFHLLGVDDMLLLVVALSLILPFIVTSSNGNASRVFSWLHGATAKSDALEGGRQQRVAAFIVRAHLAAVFVCAATLAFRAYRAYYRVYVEEVLAIRGIGLQFTSYGAFGQVRSRHFVDLKLLHSLVIHDAFYRYQLIFFLSSSVENCPRRLVYFEQTLPRMEVLQPVLKGLRYILYGEEEVGLTMAELEPAHSHVSGAHDDYSKSEESGGDETTINASDEMENSRLSQVSDCDDSV